MQENFAYIPDNYFNSNEEEERKEEENEEKEVEEQKEIILKKVVNAINIIANKELIKEDWEEEPKFFSGVINDRYKQFCDMRTNFQKHFFHYLENNIFDDTQKLLNNSFLFFENHTSHLLNYDEIELQNLSYNLDSNSNYVESYKKVDNILEDLEVNFASLKNLQQERIKPKFIDEEIENKRIDKEIKKLIINMMKKIKFCEALTKMEKNKKIFQQNKNNNNGVEDLVRKNVKMYVVSKIHNFSYEFRKNEQNFMKHLRELGGGDKEFIVNNNNNKENMLNESSSDNESEKENSTNNFLLTQEDNIETQMKKRNEDINVLADSINELSGIFKDLQSVVHEQGTILDRIDYNIDVSYENTQSGNKLLKKAEEHQEQSCFRNVILVLLFIIFIETILITLKIL